LNRSALNFSDDLVFRAFFGSERSTKSLKGLLNSILREASLTEVNSLVIRNPFLLENWSNEKEPILDVRVVDEEGCEYDVEMQCRREKHYIGRVVFYTFRLHASQLDRGDKYGALKRTVGISLTTFPIDKTRPDLWFDVWKYRSVLDSGLGYDNAINIFVRLPSSRDEQPVGIKDPELLNWLKFLAFFPNLSDEEIVTIKKSTSGVKELCEEAEMFVGTRAERELMIARERYWHDRASIRADYEEQLQVVSAKNSFLVAENSSLTAKNSSLTAANSSLTAKNSSLTAANSSLTAKNSSLIEEIRSIKEKLEERETGRLTTERKTLANMLRARFNVPITTSLARLNGIDSLETLDKLLDFSADCEDYDAFLAYLTSCEV